MSKKNSNFPTSDEYGGDSGNFSNSGFRGVVMFLLLLTILGGLFYVIIGTVSSLGNMKSGIENASSVRVLKNPLKE